MKLHRRRRVMSGLCSRNPPVTEDLVDRIEALVAAGIRIDHQACDCPADTAIARAWRNRAAGIRFTRTEADRRRVWEDKPEPHSVRGEVAPTEQTKARLRPDPLRRLMLNGFLDQWHVQAADEIREVYEALVSSMWARAAGMDRSGGGGGRRYVPPIERLRGRILDRYQRHYLPWANEWSDAWWGTCSIARGPTSAPHLTVMQVVISITVDGWTLKECAHELRPMRTEVALEAVKDMLLVGVEDYGIRAGLNRAYAKGA